MIDFIRLYRQLDIAPGCSLETFKQAYRRRVGELHPDRTRDDVSAVATLKELNLYYAAALDFHRRHGRLPGALPQGAAATGGDSRLQAAKAGHDVDRPAAPARRERRLHVTPPHEAAEPRFLHSRRFWLAAGALLLAAVWYFGEVRTDARIPRQESRPAPAEAVQQPGARLPALAPRRSGGVAARGRRLDRALHSRPRTRRA